MLEQELKDIWGELKDVWRNSSQTEQINIQMSGLIVELKSKVSQFEKDSIKRDIETIKTFTSQFEKNSIVKEISKIKSAIIKIIEYFNLKK